MRYARASGVRLRRQRLLQVVMSSMRLSRLKRLGLLGELSITSPSVSDLVTGFAVIVLTSVLMITLLTENVVAGDFLASSSSIERVAFLPVGRR